MAHQAQSHYFSCVAGCGLDSAVARNANRMPRWLRRNGGYALALLPDHAPVFSHSPAPHILDGPMTGERSKPTAAGGVRERTVLRRRNARRPAREHGRRQAGPVPHQPCQSPKAVERVSVGLFRTPSGHSTKSSMKRPSASASTPRRRLKSMRTANMCARLRWKLACERNALRVIT